LLSILEAVQEHHLHQYLSPEALRYVAATLDIPLSRVYSVAAFYPLFNLGLPRVTFGAPAASISLVGPGGEPLDEVCNGRVLTA
jgi:hypothetical protein